MAPLKRKLHAGLLALALIAATPLLAACGSSNSSGNAKSLLSQTFSGQHTVNSGQLQFSVSLTPSGSTNLTTPIAFGFGGPFQSRGQGKLPASNFNITLSGLGRNGSVGILSTGSAGYVTLKGTSYTLPAATFQKLESSFASVSASGGGGGGTSTLSKLGIHPLNWLTAPAIVGQESVAGASVTHIRAGINVNTLLADVDTLLRRASTLGVSGAGTLSGGIPAATRQRIASSVQGARVEVWTGKSDKTLRRLTLALNVPVTGQISTLLGGLKSAGISLQMQYANLNQPQQINAPTSVRPYSEFQAKLQSFVGTLQGAAGGLGGTAGTTGTPGTTGGAGTGAAGTSSNVQAYSACLQSAGTDVTKMQSCASLLSGK
ncbi:MAG TPA: hypothetical protein VLP43_00855 [Solirubrobacteraceae bacterium]|nr:hypothetical protein [Solirubrobacteraceae bacterium]